MKNVIVYRPIPEPLVRELREQFNVSYYKDITNDNRREFEIKLKEAHGLLGAGLPITATLLDRAPHLKVVSNISAGYDNFDLEELTNRGIMATNTPDAVTETTADLIFGLLMSTARRITELDRYVRAKKWDGEIEKKYFGVDVYSKTIGIVGMGRIGRAVAKRASLGFNMKVLYNKRTRDFQSEKRFGARYCELAELLGSSDYVCLSVPLTNETRQLIDQQELKQMKRNAILINGGRGPVLNQNALIKALKDHTILGAGLDVYEEEPLPYDSELLSLENVVLLPHIGSATEETRTQMAICAVDNFRQALLGVKPKNLLNPELL